MGATDPYLAHGGEDQNDGEDHEDIGGQQEEPGQVAGQHIEDGVEERLDLVLHGQGDDHEEQDHQRGDGEDLAMKVHVHPELGRGDVVLPDHVIGIDEVGGSVRGGNALGSRVGLVGFIVVRHGTSPCWRR